MKRFLCLLLCLMLVVPATLGETADTLPKRFARQLTGGNGFRGKISLTASGVAPWLTYLLPFTATEIQVRAVGENQGDMSAEVLDDDDWQIRLYAQNSNDEPAGTTWIYGNPRALYLQSELLPDTLLTIPVEQVNLLYQLFRGDFHDLFFAFDPFALKDACENGNPTAYSAMAELLGVPAGEWEASWLPVLEKYFLQLDLWLTGFGDPSFMSGNAGEMHMSATYTIPAQDLKKEAKYIISQMLFDNDLQNLLLPYVSLEQRVTYLNPSMIYFYEACIDALPLEGDIVLSREMSAMGEIVSTAISLPVPPMPEKLTAPLDQLLSDLLSLPYPVMEGADRISIRENAEGIHVEISGQNHSVIVTANHPAEKENEATVTGTLQITPNIGVEEKTLQAAYSVSYGHRVYQDESYLDHDVTTFALSVEPSVPAMSEDDPFRDAYIDFAPLNFETEVDYLNNPYKQNSPVQVNIFALAAVPDAEIELDMVLRIDTTIKMTSLPVEGGEDLLTMSEARKETLLQALIENAVITMANLDTASPEATLVPAASEPTAVPPQGE